MKMRINKHRLLAVGLFFLLITYSCSAQKHIDKENLQESYSTDNPLKPEYKVFHLSKTNTIIYYQFNFGDFNYKRKNPESSFKAKYSLTYQLFYNFLAKELIDSASVIFEDSLNYGKNNSSLGYFELEIPENAKYVLRLKLHDLNTNNEVVTLLNIDKSSILNRQNFYLQANDGLPVMHNYVSKKIGYQLVYNQLETKKLHVKYFKQFYKPPPPPMNDSHDKKILRVKADSIYSVKMTNGRSEKLIFKKQGLYHFYADSTSQEGFTVMVFTSGYPYVNTQMQMLMPIRYITTNSEYKKLLHSNNKKSEVDRFWIKISSNSERAKAMLAIYYNRVQVANVLFCADREGWMTDRGMIYIIYGPPERVFKNEGLETWAYGTAKHRTSLKFNFIQNDNPFTNNDFSLNRAQSYLNSWNTAIEVWRR